MRQCHHHDDSQERCTNESEEQVVIGHPTTGCAIYFEFCGDHIEDAKKAVEAARKTGGL